MDLNLFNFQTFEDLKNGGLANIPNEEGIYVVMAPDDFEITFSDGTSAITSYNGKNMLYTGQTLREKFERSDQRILYIGQASGEDNKLKDRIEQLIKYGYNQSGFNANNHRGGRAIWQINNNRKLQLGYLAIDCAQSKEKMWLVKYKKTYSTYPVANWRK
jgi:hypothetical protein